MTVGEADQARDADTWGTITRQQYERWRNEERQRLRMANGHGPIDGPADGEADGSTCGGSAARST